MIRCGIYVYHFCDLLGGNRFYNGGAVAFGYPAETEF